MPTGRLYLDSPLMQQIQARFVNVESLEYGLACAFRGYIAVRDGDIPLRDYTIPFMSFTEVTSCQ